MDFEKFNDIRPYKDDEIQAAMHRIAESPHISNIASYLYPGIDVNMFKQLLISCSTVDDFQKKVMRNVVQKIVSGTMKNLTHSGIENFEQNCKKAAIIAKDITVGLLAEINFIN